MEGPTSQPVPQPTPLIEPPTGPPMIGYAALSNFQAHTLGRRLRRAFLRRLMWVGIGLALLVLFIGLFQLLRLSFATAVLGVVACTICTTIAAGCLRAARRQRAMTVITYCEQGIRLSLPLPQFLRAVAANESPRMARRLISIAETLEAPAPLGGALRGELPELPTRIGEILRGAEANGTLAPALSRVVRDERPVGPDDVSMGAMPLAYLAMVGGALTMAVIAFSVLVMPKLAQIYRDFGMRTPPAWNVLNRLNPLLGSALLIATALAATLIILGVLGRNARWIFFRRLEHDRPLRAISDRLLWCTPVFGSQARDRDLADVCQALADGLDHQRPFDTLLREAASPHLNEVTLGRLEEWSRLLVQGEPLSQAARGAWMPGLICGLIGNASRSSDSLAPTFAFLARHYHRRSVQRGAWLSAAVMPAVTLMCGAVVTFCALTLWVPLCAIIDATLPYQTRL